MGTKVPSYDEVGGKISRRTETFNFLAFAGASSLRNTVEDAGECRSLLSMSHANPGVEEVLASYRAAHYCIEPAGASAVDLRIGERSAGLTALYGELNVETCAFLTASNPLGVALRAADNAVAMTALCVDVHAMGLALLPGVGRDGDPASSWPGEESVAVFGISRDAACEIGDRYQQNAIVWAGFDAVPKLVLLRST